jgi:acetate kinase
MSSSYIDAEKQVYESLLDVQLGYIARKLTEGSEIASRWHIGQMDQIVQIGTRVLSADIFTELSARVDNQILRAVEAMEDIRGVA